jgi:hypothetical protein
VKDFTRISLFMGEDVGNALLDIVGVKGDGVERGNAVGHGLGAKKGSL